MKHPLPFSTLHNTWGHVACCLDRTEWFCMLNLIFHLNFILLAKRQSGEVDNCPISIQGHVRATFYHVQATVQRLERENPSVTAE